MKKLLLVSLLFASALFLFQSCKSKSEKKLYTIGIISLIEAPILDTARAGIIEGLALKGFVDGKNIKIDYINAQGELSSVPVILKKFSSDKVDLIITITTPCMVTAAQLIKDIPVIFTVAFSPAQMGIKQLPKNITGISDPMEMSEFVQLIKKINPSLRVLGMPLNTAEVNSVFSADRLEAECKKQNIELIKLGINSTNDIPQAAEALVLKNIDAFAVSADNTVNAGIKTLVKIAEKHKLPVFATATDLVENGSCAGIGADYKKWGEAAGIMAASVINGQKIEEIPIKNINSYNTAVNLRAAKAQGVTLPDDLLNSAGIIIK